MENSSKLVERENPSPLTSPNSNSSSTSCNSNGIQPHLTPKPTCRSETNANPTTFIVADTASFKQVVQMLTGSSSETTTTKQATKTTADQSSKSVIPPKKQGFKLYERRNSLKNLKISPSMPGLVQNYGFSPRQPDISSPSMLDFPSLVLSPVTPLIRDPFNRSPSPCANTNSNGDLSAEETAIAKKRFYFHPSPINSPRDQKPLLLPLFPVTSPRVSGSS